MDLKLEYERIMSRFALKISKPITIEINLFFPLLKIPASGKAYREKSRQRQKVADPISLIGSSAFALFQSICVGKRETFYLETVLETFFLFFSERDA